MIAHFKRCEDSIRALAKEHIEAHLYLNEILEKDRDVQI